MRLFALAVGDGSRDNPPTMASNVISISAGPRWRLLIAHQRSDVRHVVRTLIETEHTAIIEVSDGDAALMALEHGHFDVLVLELDLPVKDGVSVMQIHRLLLAHECRHVEPPAIVFRWRPRCAATRRSPITCARSASPPSSTMRPARTPAPLIDALLHARGAGRAQGKPAAAWPRASGRARAQQTKPDRRFGAIVLQRAADTVTYRAATCPRFIDCVHYPRNSTCP